MSDQQALNATFFAFRKREGGGVLVGASIAFQITLIVLLVLVLGGAFALLGGGEFAAWYGKLMQAAANGDTSAAATPPPNLGGVFLIVPLYLVFLFVVFVLYAAFEFACVRWMVRGERSGPLNLHFGADMWRVYATYWVWFLYVLVGWIAFAVFEFVVGLISGNAGDAGGWIVAGATVAFMLAWFYVTVRLSPAAATSVGVGKFAPQRAWSATRGRFWALFGAYLLVFIIYIIAYIVVASVMMGAFFAQLFNGVNWSEMQSNPEGFAAAYQRASMEAMQHMFSSPTSIALYVGGQIAVLIVACVFYVLTFGVASRTVQAALEEGKIEREPAEA